jgi:hypothetical protein
MNGVIDDTRNEKAREAGQRTIFVAERRLTLARPFKAGKRLPKSSARRIATVETISFVADATMSRAYADPSVETPG